jgi:hypothetical protein
VDCCAAEKELVNAVLELRREVQEVERALVSVDVLARSGSVLRWFAEILTVVCSCCPVRRRLARRHLA